MKSGSGEREKKTVLSLGLCGTSNLSCVHHVEGDNHLLSSVLQQKTLVQKDYFCN